MKRVFALVLIMLISHLFGGFRMHGGKELPDLVRYVNPFIGTGGHGHTYPGASMPFGMVQLSPDTRLEGWDGCSGYHYSDSVIYGFSHTHLSGTGVPDYCDILFMPVQGGKFSEPHERTVINYTSEFSHTEESAEAGYYSVMLKRWGIRAELSATKRAGIHRYTFPLQENKKIFIDLRHRDEVLDSKITIINSTEISGYRFSRSWAKKQMLFFHAKFSVPISETEIFTDEQSQGGIQTAEGRNIKALLGFENGSSEVIVKVGLSAVSGENAKKNLDAEIPSFDFGYVREEARKEWNRELNKIQAEGGTEENKTVFYTALYHSLLNPNIYTDVDGRFRGTDLEVHTASGFDNYTVFSLWDTYRALHPLLTIIDTKRTNDFINTFIAQYEYGGMLPVWELSGNETWCMIGYHSIPVIADAYVKGIRGYDAYKIFSMMKKTADKDIQGLDSYKKYGHIPQDREHESVSKTLEYAYDDWCIAQMSQPLRRQEDYQRFIRRAQYYKNLFDPSTGFMRAKINGCWYEPFDPAEVNNNYTEANAWQYSFYVPQDISGLAGMHGGKDKLALKLDSLFDAEPKLTGREQSDITGLIGQYAHGNEPSHHIAYMYNYLNQPWKTQELVRKIMKDFYRNSPDGLIGNEDCGQMSAWYVFSAMGFFPVCPGQLQYAAGAPAFEKITINLESGRKFVIRAENYGPENIYVKSVMLNGYDYGKTYIDHNDIIRGGEMIFVMDSKPEKTRGISDTDAPYSAISDYLINPVPYITSEGKSFYKYNEINISGFDRNDKIYYTTDGTEPGINSLLFWQPLVLSQTTGIKAVSISPHFGQSHTIEAAFYRVPDDKAVQINSVFSSQYTAGGPEALINGVRGQKNWRTGNWQGYQGQDFEAVIDLKSEKYVEKISAGFLQDIGAWIAMPSSVEVYISDNGYVFEFETEIKNDIPMENREIVIREFTSEVGKKTRYIKIIARSQGKLPEWHPGAGHNSWIFIDEISVFQQ